MTAETEGFPDNRDLMLQSQVERLANMADELVDWIGHHASPRREGDFEISNSDEFKLLRLRRLAANLWNSSKVPVASAVYGPSQTGKSLFMGRVLDPADNSQSPLGKCDKMAPPTYIRELSFAKDLNPENKEKEATALVTRFTTKDRFDSDALPEYPVKIRALSRSEWLRVLARGFRSECPQKNDIIWEEGQVRDLFDRTSQSHGAETGDRDWQMDLIDSYTFMRNIDRKQFHLDESMFNSFLSQYPLTEQGYVEVAGRLFWDSQMPEQETFVDITKLFNKVNEFLKKVSKGGRDGILVHWGAVRFLLDSEQLEERENEESKWMQLVRWSDFKSEIKDGWYCLDYREGAGGPDDDLGTIQSAMLEMIVPLVPHRLNEDWREVVMKMDVLDLPGMRAGGGDAQVKAVTGKTREDKMKIVKRGKVFYLIERYIDERQVQTLLMLMRGGNVEVGQLLKQYIDQWGRTRYGEEEWPGRVADSIPALFVGMTGLDADFERFPFNNKEVYNNRLRTIANDVLFEVMTDFGGPGRPFTNVYPIRYPGTWDTDEERRRTAPHGGVEKWDKARDAFLNSELALQYVSDPQRKWEVAMKDGDGGMSLVSRGFLQCTSSVQKQDALQQQIKGAHQDIRNLAEGWYCDPNSNKDREKRTEMAKKILDWLEDEEKVYERSHALQVSLCFDEGNANEIAGLVEQKAGKFKKKKETLEQQVSNRLTELLKDWGAKERWENHAATHDGGAPWLDVEDFQTFTRFLGDYLRTQEVFNELAAQLLSVIGLQIKDQDARRHALREYVLLILNDYVMNPGSSDGPLEKVEETDGHDFGLMKPFIQRWRGRLPLALASAAGKHTEIPSGNDELDQILQAY